MSLSRLAVLALLAACAASADEAPAIPHLAFERAWSRLVFRRPVALVQAPGDADRRFVVEQNGTIRVFPAREDADPAGAACYLDISGKVLRYHEESGLLGLAFHPRFAENGFFYLYYSDKTSYKGGRAHTALLSRFHADPKAGRAEPDSEAVLLKVDQPYPNHNGGCLQFGPDGFLYLGLGDGGAAGDPQDRAQDLRSPLGKILRLDVDPAVEGRAYGIPKDNPFAAAPEKGLPEIYAWGFRNPWRFSFDRKTGELWVGDVGQDHFEWVHVVKRGGNHGWNLREGRHPFKEKEKGGEPAPDLVQPVAEYSHADGKSITGGYVYRGKRFPALDGVYVYADYGSGRVWGFRRGSAPIVVAEGIHALSSFAEDVEGELFAVSLDGQILRVRPAP